MGKYKTSEAQRRASKKYKQRNPERTKITSYRTTARTFVRHYATKEDMENLMEVFKKENKNYKENKMTKTKKLTVDYLTAVYYDNDMNQYTLEFDNSILLDVDASEFEGQEITDDFFDDEENLKKAIEEGEVRE